VGVKTKTYRTILIVFKWFIPVVCDYKIKYQNDIRWVSQNTTIYYGVRCQKIDNLMMALQKRAETCCLPFDTLHRNKVLCFDSLT